MLRWNARIVCFRGKSIPTARNSQGLRILLSGCIGGGQPEGFPSRSTRCRDAPDSENEVSWADREP